MRIFDTTPRGGEQSPGTSFSHEGKREIAALLDEMGTHVIEAGFPVNSEAEFEAVSAAGPGWINVPDTTGVATPAEAAPMIRHDCDGIVVGSGIFGAEDPEEMGHARRRERRPARGGTAAGSGCVTKSPGQ